jgi:catechol 2,3-dioxygenase-like lactoylglutathione lyase family enzyme
MLSTNLMRYFFQLGYVTPDLDRAIEQYRERFGISEFLTFDTRAMQPDAPYHVRIGLAWTGSTMVELIEPVGEHPLYDCAMPEQGFDIRLHHLGYLVPDEATFAAAERDLGDAKIPIVSRADVPDYFQVVYADARASTGHHLEVVLAKPGGQAMFDAAPRA